MLKIKGPGSIDLTTVMEHVHNVNNGLNQTVLLIYYDLCNHFGIDYSVAIAQACLETDWFRSRRAVANHNYCGLGADSTHGVEGFKTDSMVLGVFAHVSHLLGYCDPGYYALAADTDPKYSAARNALKGMAVYVDDLGGPGRWTDDPRYGYNIWRVYIELGGK